jgi:hypothetical protein
MEHLNEEELIDHYYGEDRDPGAATRHMADCAECAGNYRALEADLSEVKDADLPVRDAAYGERVWRSIAGSLPEQPQPSPLWMRPGLWRGLVYAASLAVLLAAAFFAGRISDHTKARIAVVKPPAHSPQRVVVVVLSDHLDRSERLLVELKHADVRSSEMLMPLRDEARTLLPANRICEKEAESSDDPELEKALTSLDGVLTELANKPGGLNAEAIARLQDEMRSEGLLFEVRVLRSRIPAHGETRAAHSEGGTI